MTDVLIIGGGVIGLSTAYELAGQGVAVRVLEQGRLGREASWAGAGMLPPGNPEHAAPPDMLRAFSHVRWPALAEQLRDETGIDDGYLRSGCVRIPAADEVWGHDLDVWRSEGVVIESLDADDVAAIESGLAGHVFRASFLPEMAQVRNPRHLDALIAGCRARGVEFHEGEPAIDFETDGETVLAVRTPTNSYSGGRFCVAGGAWSRQLLERVGLALPVEPVRGQIVLLRTPGTLLRRIVEQGSRYLVPRADGRVLVGSTEERAGFDKRTTATAIRELLAFAIELVPALGEAEIERTWAGLRPGSPDQLPFLDRVPDFENLFVAAGHFRVGLQTSPATALLMRELLLEQPPSFDPSPFGLERVLAPRA